MFSSREYMRAARGRKITKLKHFKSREKAKIYLNGGYRPNNRANYRALGDNSTNFRGRLGTGNPSRSGKLYNPYTMKPKTSSSSRNPYTTMKKPSRSSFKPKLINPYQPRKETKYSATKSRIMNNPLFQKGKLLGKRSRAEITQKKTSVFFNKKSTDLSGVTWNREQQKVIDIVSSGKNIFFTGSAGSGKSLVIEKLRQILIQKYDINKVFVTATTGISAVNIAGQTIHRFAGIGVAREYSTMLKNCERARKSKFGNNNWKEVRALIIDEVSMLDAKLFENLEKLARTMKRNTLPFGGIQLILTGDFFQLPPVRMNGNAKFTFECQSWNDCIHNYVNLQRIYRQSDAKFVKILNNIRVGICTNEMESILRACSRPLSTADDIMATKLYSTNKRVLEINMERLKALKTTNYKYESIDDDVSGKMKKEMRTKYLDNTQGLKILNLKKGAQVILVRNLSENLVNGSRGIIVSFKRPHDRFERMGGGEKDDFDSNFGTVKKRKKKSNWKRKCDEYIDEFYSKKGHSLVPIVRFANGIEAEINPEVFSVTTRDYTIVRIQIPLKLAWAITIHKSQGLSIDKAEISMKKMFAKGQFYVALSRVRSLKGLCLKNFDKKQIKVDQRVIVFMKKRFPSSIKVEGNIRSGRMNKESFKPKKKKRKLKE